ncbi:hypothetical protein [Xylophilus sp.]|uniref:hypothetical protein n=1 Tax=Xylophilus sp. TaxID=2653893 RepID=UPI002D7F6892|nr:hypothetical protein [Xylophilus sp.]
MLLIGSVAVLAGAATLTAWSLLAQQPGWRHAAGWLTWAIGLAWWLAAWRRSPRGQLAWTGAQWRWQPGSMPAGESAGQLAVRLDAQRFLLAAWQPLDGGGPACWFWLERRSDPGRWPDLRRAVYSPARADGMAP